MEDELLLAVELASKLGAQYSEARFERARFQNIVVRNGALDAYTEAVDKGVSIRVLINGSMGFASTNILSRDEITEAVKAAVKDAKNASKLTHNPIILSEEENHRASWSTEHRIDPEDVPFEEKLQALLDIEKNLRDIKPVKLPVRIVSVTTSTTEKIYLNSEGTRIRSCVTRTGIGYNIIALAASKGTLQRRNRMAATVGWEGIEAWKPWEVAREEAETLALILLKGRSPPKGRLDMVLGSEVVGIIVHESCGHPSEADRIMGREAAQAGESYMTSGMLGTRIGSPAVTIIDDPTIPGSYGFYLYDDEGVKGRPRYLFKKGIVNEFLHNRETAAVFNTSSNGSARASAYNREPIVRMANTYMAPGDYGFDELLEDVKRGVFIKTYMEWNIDDRRWNQRYVGLEAYTIEKGEVKDPVRNPVLEVTTEVLYKNVDAVDRNLRFYPGTCGKGEPGQGVPVWFGGPNIRVRNMILGVAL